ncbi:DEAD/DEAH box helicase [Faecalibacterium hominis (ex Afrizal et al. 2022)]|uniref:DEAD/DEAH box helicase n=1 Tax=Faecalibacterium hominis (ex Afrizal et al. 2022) TaxID=2881265 RepID=UPI001D0EAB8B|nr:DEAD/DEAH box helicase [Faecalibacterium hominis (ex Afrizal et al. 2022)]MCC2122212.1 DEAD/DEAH box helicase [Faecalibacterium hominis (ex Afrizal et al. 2022)]
MTFNELNLSAPVLRAVAQAGYESPSPIQAAAIPPVLAGRDLMGCAQTGTGKTAAFALPMLDCLTASAPRKKGAIRALILTPTRELALQIGESFETYGRYLTLRSTVIFGGVGQAPQVAALKKGVDILIACPGRLNDLVGQGLLDLSNIEIFVLDEADRMLDMGFVHDVKKVIAKLPGQRQNLMFSATMPKEIEQLAAGILHDPAFVKVDPVSSTVDRIQQSLYFVEKGNKKFLLPWLIKNLKPEVVNALVFSRTKHGADKIAKDLNKQGIPAAAIHGNKSQTARVTALEDFKAGKTRVLVATDIAARGIDISELSHVFNYDLPEVPETYVHRIGRTARAGADGTAISFCAPEEKEYLAGIEKLNRRQIPVVSGHPWDGVPAPVKAAPPVRGKKPKAEAEQPVKAEQPAKAEKAAKAEKPAAPKKEKAAAKQPSPKNTEPKEGTSMEENQKRTSGGRNENRRSNNSRTRREGNAQQPANRGSNAQPKFDPHFVSAPEATPLRPVKKAPAAQPAAKQTAPAQNGQRQRGGQPARAEQRTDRNDPRTEQRAERNARNARPAQNGQSQQSSRNNRNAVQSSRPDRPAKSEAPRSRSRNTAPARDEDPGLMLISRRPPQQKFTNFEEYMTAHGGATAPIEDHTDET